MKYCLYVISFPDRPVIRLQAVAPLLVSGLAIAFAQTDCPAAVTPRSAVGHPAPARCRPASAESLRRQASALVRGDFRALESLDKELHNRLRDLASQPVLSRIK